jgi:hypothetical protein
VKVPALQMTSLLIFFFKLFEHEGYFARWAALRKLLYQFLDVEKKTDENGPTKTQILSLGAGFDTTYFQLQVPELELCCAICT